LGPIEDFFLGAVFLTPVGLAGPGVTFFPLLALGAAAFLGFAGASTGAGAGAGASSGSVVAGQLDVYCVVLRIYMYANIMRPQLVWEGIWIWIWG
jgi:hypothetical protein